jgi:subtilisin-like proprotein convertase family protein
MRLNSLHVLLTAAWVSSPIPLPAAQAPQPVETSQIATRPDYQTTGLIEGAYSWGSGVVAESPGVVLSCAHVVYDNIYQQWTSGSLWYRAYNGAAAPDINKSQILNGYFYWRSYATAVAASERARKRLLDYPLELPLPERLENDFFRATAAEFNLDAAAHFSYAEDLGGGQYARVVKDGAARLASGAAKWITGYPSGRYGEDDPLAYRLHDTGEFGGQLVPEFRTLKNYVSLYDEVETGSGNSGGPVWVRINGGEPVVAGVLVSGAEEQTEGESFVGVHATSAQSWNLIKAAMTAAAQGDQTRSKSFPFTGGAAIPDAERIRVPGGNRLKAGELVRSFRVAGLPKIIEEVRVDLVVKHPARKDLRVILQTPGKRRLPVYEGFYDEEGEDVTMDGERAPLFYGLNPNGLWVLRVLDEVPADAGSLVSATVHITAR